ncbi:NB-ARC domain-containing protein [Leptolyngbya sp. NIES-2104]|uniref:NB-ARC domain-containing protein n=1 Tax=Leptolyngbya sp. NIES-2104 TaxID=1552121 RepID=UPI0006EC8BA0|nr:NB-ARC domain-containing protein [Leptolyngbya sp. NIES-2104]GAP95610.1 high-affnity carbon uptake protein Hat/HatR [Leptolyngbya sp. NIES-2104]
MVGLRASETGKQQIRQVIEARNWNMTDERALMAASQRLGSSRGDYAKGVSETTWKRFVYASRRIHRRTFQVYCEVLELDWKTIAEVPDPKASRDDLSLMPLLQNFYGRSDELKHLTALLLKYQFVILYGAVGIGKTSIAVKLVEQVQPLFDRRIWVQFDHRLPIEQLLLNLLHTLSETPRSFPQDLTRLTQILRQDLANSKLLIVLDEVNPDQGDRVNYQHLIRTLQDLGQTHHQSCILVTTRERPPDFTALMREQAVSQVLIGLDSESGCKIIEDGRLRFEPEIGQKLVDRYSGNPLALKLVCPIVRDLFQGQVHKFLEHSDIYVSELMQQALIQQIQTLTEFERTILRLLAQSEPLSQRELQDELQGQGSLIEGLDRLGRRSLIEKVIEGHDVLYTLQPMILEVVRRHLKMTQSHDRLR